MTDEIILLTGEAEAPHLAETLKRHAPEAAIVHAPDADALEAACAESGPRRRLIGFCTDIIVPARLLDSLAAGAYNFHPASPEYPGSHGASFAVYEAASRFGATAHEMLAEIDAGAIVGVRWFDVTRPIRYMDLEFIAFRELATLFFELAPALADLSMPLPPSGDVWSGPVRLKADFERMREIEPDMSEEEIGLRVRAFG